jgi:lantibiotic modifying enzyme
LDDVIENCLFGRQFLSSKHIVMFQSTISGKRQPLTGTSLHGKIRTIADSLYANKGKVKESGLLSGDAGITLFFAYLTIAWPESHYEEITQEYLGKLSDALAGERMSHNLSAGIAGIAFVFQHLRNIGLLDGSEDIGLGELDEMISRGGEQDFSDGNWDPLHGLVGLGIYFIERHKETEERKYLERIVDQLNALSSTEKGCSVWVTRGFKHYSQDNYNFGMAHGMPGLLSFLAQVYRLGIRRSVIEELVPSCFSYLFMHYGEKEEWYSFPGSIEVKPVHETGEVRSLPTRNGWCYGDLGMANALIHCGRALAREDWVDLGVGIALKTTLIPFEESHCGDAPFCHGAVGLVHQYNRLYEATHNSRFKDAAMEWLIITGNHYYQPDKYDGGYAYRSFDETTKRYQFISSFGLLEGLAGIGVTYLNCCHDIRPDWDILFQTNL